MKRLGGETNSCPKAVLIDPLLDGVLEAEAKAALLEHLRRCDACREERAHLLFLRQMSRALPRPEISREMVQRAKSTLFEQARGRAKRTPGEWFADIFADRPYALHLSAMALGLVISLAAYGLGRLHESRSLSGSQERAASNPGGVADRGGESRRNFEPGGFGSAARIEARIESMSDPESESEVEAPREGDRAEKIDAPDLQEEEAPPTETSRPKELLANGAKREVPKELLSWPTRPKEPAVVPSIVFSDQAYRTLLSSGSLAVVTREISDAVPNWGKILSEGLLGHALLNLDPPKGARSSRNMVVVLDDGKASIRLHITIAFGSDVEPHVQVRKVEEGARTRDLELR